jgi:DNA-binding transcriptional LysR family regulator
MDLQRLEMFLAVVQAGGFAAVAKDRGMDASTVSRAIAALEAELGVRLFQRTTRSFSLTEAGEAYRARIEPALEELLRAGAEASRTDLTPRGVLRLTASVAFGVQRIAPLLPEFRTTYPAIKIECLFTDANLDLVAERIDLAIRLAPAIQGDLIALKLMETRYHVVASPDYLMKAPVLRKPADLARHRCLLLALRPFRSAWRFRSSKGDIQEVAVDGDVVISSPLALRAAAVAGCGPALLADFIVADDLREGRLVDAFPRLRAAATSFDTGAWAIYPSRAFLPKKVRVMIDFLKKRIG